jgi:hypothetical protein
MHLEIDRTCELCLRAFIVGYDFVGEHAPSARDTLTQLFIPCPRCGHANRLYMLPWAADIVCRRPEAPAFTRSRKTA